MRNTIFRSFLFTIFGVFTVLFISACTQQTTQPPSTTPPPSSEQTPPSTPSENPPPSTTPTTPEGSETQPSPPPSSTTPSENETTQDTSKWETYTSNEYNFQIKYPPTWKLQAADSNNVKGVVISKGTANESQIGIFPQGEFDVSLPPTTPTTSDDTLAGKKVKIQRWDAGNGVTLAIYYFMEDTKSSWKACNADLKNCNRIQVLATSNEDLATMEKMLDNFKFI